MAEYKYGDFPTLEEIKRDYNELMEIIQNVRTLEQVKALDDAKKFTIEINGMFVDEFVKRNLTDKDIECIRYENYGCLSYIYNHLGNVVFGERLDDIIIFDVWSEYCYDEFIRDITIDKLTEDLYAKAKAEAIEWYRN